jgi:hypothetical protein
MIKELNALSEGDFTPVFQTLNSTASALMQLMPMQDNEAQQYKDILNPPDMLKPEQTRQNEQDNYNNVDLAPRPGR